MQQKIRSRHIQTLTFLKYMYHLFIIQPVLGSDNKKTQ